MFLLFVLGLVAGMLLFYQLPTLPSVFLLTVSSVVLLVFVWWQRKRLLNTIADQVIRTIIPCLLGGLFAFWWALSHVYLTPILPDAFVNQKVSLKGEIIGLPKITETHNGQQKIAFELRIDAITFAENHQAWSFWKPRVRLSWYLFNQQKLPDIRPGDSWQFAAKLKPIHASLNPGGFDYERYQFQRGIQASGYVLSQLPAEKLQPGGSLRADLSDHLQQLFANQAFSGIYQALLIGDRQQITGEQWSVLQKTGTIHLMAISGLHIGLMAGIGFWLFAWVWKQGVLHTDWHLWHRTPRLFFSLTGALLFATLYMAMAGFSIPTQRAWLMVVAFVLFGFSRRKFRPWGALALAALLILLWEPRSVLSVGFWLSFLAVAIIFRVLAQPGFSSFRNWQKLLWIQFWLSIGMLPVLAFLYQQVPTLSFIANLIAVPVVSIIGLPLLFITLIASWLLPFLNEVLLLFNQWIWQVLWWFLQVISNQDSAQWLIGEVLAGRLAVAYILLFAVLAVQRFQLWVKAGIALVVIVVLFTWSEVSAVKLGQFRLSVLDVGQGQALVIETADHTVVYDTGAKWTDKLDGASLAILPYLKTRAIDEIDLLMVSHSDLDHAGGVDTLLKQQQIKQAVSGQAEQLNQGLDPHLHRIVFEPCYQGQQWQFDGVQFEVIAPQRHAPYRNDNDQSCVLKVSDGKLSVLIMGDASQQIEQQLLAQKTDVSADILIAGHHGSRSSSSEYFLQAVSPGLVIFSSGYLNRFGFPHKEVIKRIEKLPAKWLNTACSGSVHISVTKENWQIDQLTRQVMSRWYHHPGSC